MLLKKKKNLQDILISLDPTSPSSLSPNALATFSLKIYLLTWTQTSRPWRGGETPLYCPDFLVDLSPMLLKAP